jgi:ABC-type transport system substrate-binding protein
MLAVGIRSPSALDSEEIERSMLTSSAKRVLGITLALSFILMAVSPMLASAATVPGGAKSGPYVNKIVFKVITGADQEVLSLLNSQIDLIGEMVEPQFLASLQAADNIHVVNVPRNGYGFITMKCDKYPFNITGFRRALAFAIDKNAISDEVWAGLSQPQDSCVPRVNPYTIEGSMPYTYYESNMPLASQLLNQSGFYDTNADGWREAPNGAVFKPVVVCSGSTAIAVSTATIVVNTLKALHINAILNTGDFNTFYIAAEHHEDYDILFHGLSFTTYDVDWLGYMFWSGYAHEPFQNEPCWSNATYDSWRDQLLHSTNYTLVYQAAQEMQKIWIYNCPEIILYENTLLSAYRTDQYEGYVNDAMSGVPSFWTNYKVHLQLAQGGPFGGSFRWSLPQDIDSFNLLATTSAYAWDVLNQMYDTLIGRDYQGNDLPWLASSWAVATHADDSSVPSGHTRITFNMIQNATWSDGEPLTADDVAFSLNFYRDAPGNPFGPYVKDMTAAYAKTTYQLVVEFSTVSYWHLHACGYQTVIPKHFFLEHGITTANWNTWTPNPPTDDIVCSGPFNITNYVRGEFCEQTYNPNYFYGVAHTTTTTTTTEAGPNFTLAIVAGAVGAAVVILVGGYVLMRQK